MRIKALLCALSAFICTYTGAAESEPKQPVLDLKSAWSFFSEFYDKANRALYPDFYLVLPYLTYHVKDCEKYITAQMVYINRSLANKRQSIVDRFIADRLTMPEAWEEYRNFLQIKKDDLLKTTKLEYSDRKSTVVTDVIRISGLKFDACINSEEHKQKFECKLTEAKLRHRTATSIIALFCGFFGGALQTIINQHTVTPPTNLAGSIFSVLSAGFLSSTMCQHRRISVRKPLLGPVVATATGHLLGQFCTKKLIALVNQRFIEDMIFPALCHPST